MPRRPAELPAALTAAAFTMATARDQGVGEKRLRHRDLLRPLHGVRVPAQAPGDLRRGESAVQRRTRDLARVAALVLPADAAFSHCTAALIHGLPLPRLREHPEPLHVIRHSSRNPVDRPQVTPHRGLELREVSVRGAVRLVSEADTWVDLGTLLGVEELVVVGDRVARRANSVAPLHEALERRGSPRGVVRLREALRWIRVGSDSGMETRSRLLFCRHGLPEPELNAELTAADGSGFLCRSDFVWREAKVIGEYQGGHHFGTFERGDDDIARRLLAEDDDWKYVELTKNDYFNPARRLALVHRLGRYLGVEKVANHPHPAWTGRFATPSAPC